MKNSVLKNHHNNEKFPGFPPEPITNYWQYPKALNGWWHALTPTEQKVLDYILRHTWGYKKNADAIAISQFINGITKHDGTIVDKGTGIKNEKTVRKSLKGLILKGFIEREDRGKIGKEPIYKLKIAPSQELVPLPIYGTPLVPEIGATPYQEAVPTIKDISINNNNNISATQKGKKTYSTEITLLIGYLSEQLGGIRYPNYPKQARSTKAMLDAGYSIEDIKWAIDKLQEDDWWKDKSFDMKNVADQIPILMGRTFKKK